MGSPVAYPLEEYKPPQWAGSLLRIPKYKVQLIMPNTPIHKWFLPGTPEGFEVSIKRDDMTGSLLLGNKIRKLEFLLADARAQGCDAVITCGAVRSNHCRATAIAARQMGMDSHLLMWSDDSPLLKGSFKGNTLLDWMIGCNFYLLPKDAKYDEHMYPRIQQLTEYLSFSCGKKAYSMPLGGSNVTGIFGYIECFRELLEQGVQDKFTDIVITTSSSGSMAGLVIGNYLTGNKLKITGMSVLYDDKYVHGQINGFLRELGLQGGQGSQSIRSEDLCDIVEAKGIAYAVSHPDELECIKTVARATGIVVDPLYTGKAVFHLIRLMREEPSRFKGKKILFVHTGGVFDVFNGLMESLADARSPAENQVYDWLEMTDKPPNAQSN